MEERKTMPDNARLSKRGTQWNSFSALVMDHVENYTVPQYGDAPNDQVESWSAQDCVVQIRRYAARFGSGQRGKAEELRDLLKIAHYACLAHNKRT
jgi:hypothetical protein